MEKVRELTEAAQAAKMIRSELKKAFPGIKFSVRSSNFSMGDSVSIGYTDAMPSELVEAITGKFQYGYFDGMTDMYEYSNRRRDIPQSKYVSVSRRISPEIWSELKRRLSEYYEIDMDNNSEVMKKFSVWPDSLIHRFACKIDFRDPHWSIIEKKEYPQ